MYLKIANFDSFLEVLAYKMAIKTQKLSKQIYLVERQVSLKDKKGLFLFKFFL